jgi:hypothetical protein
MRGTDAAQEADVPEYPDASPAKEALGLRHQLTDRMAEGSLCPVGAERRAPRIGSGLAAAH